MFVCYGAFCATLINIYWMVTELKNTEMCVYRGSPWSLKVLKFSTLKFKDLKSALK